MNSTNIFPPVHVVTKLPEQIYLASEQSAFMLEEGTPSKQKTENIAQVTLSISRLFFTNAQGGFMISLVCTVPTDYWGKQDVGALKRSSDSTCTNPPEQETDRKSVV